MLSAPFHELEQRQWLRPQPERPQLLQLPQLHRELTDSKAHQLESMVYLFENLAWVDDANDGGPRYMVNVSLI